MATAVTLPSLGESVVEGTVARWLVQEGDAVEVDQPLVEITTDKVDAEIPSPEAGVVDKILVAEGDVVEVGADLVLLRDAGEGDAPSKPEKEKKKDDSESAAAEPAAEPAAERGPASEEEPPAGQGDDARATPLAARMAEEANLDLSEVEGTGSGGRITKEDVLRAGRRAEAAEPAAREPEAEPAPAREAPARPAARAPEGQPAASAEVARTKAPAWATPTLEEGDRVVPMTSMRRIIAEHMVYSKRTSPHVGTVAEVDMGGVVAIRQANKKAFEERTGVSLTYLPFIVQATVRALREFPALNASVADDSIIERAGIHIGIAVETDKGLVVPVVRNADRLSLSGLVAAIDELSGKARSRKLTADDLRGGTFTISNPGRRGNLYGFAIINQPQVGILRLGEMVKRPVVRSVDGSDAIVIRPMMHLALSYDHRAVDGAPANGFLYRIRELLESAEFDL